MKFVLITGPQAVGKMTVGQELEKITDLKLPFAKDLVLKKALKVAEGTVVEDLLKRYKLI